MDNINQSYTCPRCGSVFPLNDKSLHDSMCTGPIFPNSNVIGRTLLNPNMIINTNNSNNINNNDNNNNNINDIERVMDDNGNIIETKKEVTSNGSIKKTIIVKDMNGNIKSQSVNISSGNNLNNNMMFNFSSFNSNMPNNVNMPGTGLNNLMSNMINNISNMAVNNLNINMNNENVNHGLDPQIINNLLVIKSNLSELSENEITCIICMDDFKNDEDVIYLPCQHLFHRDCIYEWFKINDCCPTCKLKLTRENTDIYA